MLYPLLLTPIYQDYIWGGWEIVTRYDRSAPAKKRYAESWEVCDREGAVSVVQNGPLAGQSLHEVIEAMPFELYGTSSVPKVFPLLIKLIDAHENLSVQVHPAESEAIAHKGEPKSEAWYVLDAKPGSKIYAGLKSQLTKQEFTKLAGSKALVDCMHTFEVKTGDVFYLPGGTLHSIGEGVLLLEVQQNADTSYRVYDWERKLDDGSSRPLHIEDAADSVHIRDVHMPFVDRVEMHASDMCDINQLVHTPYFSMKHVNAKSSLRLDKQQNGCEILFVEGGSGTLIFDTFEQPLLPGMTLLIPHVCKQMTLETTHCDFVVIRPEIV